MLQGTKILESTSAGPEGFTRLTGRPGRIGIRAVSSSTSVRRPPADPAA